MAHPNAEVARKASEALAKGDVQGFLAFHTEDIKMHVPGRNRLSGTYEGKDQFGKLFQQQFEMLDEPPNIDVHDIVANDDHAVVLVKQTFTRGGKSLSVDAIVLLHVKDGKIAEAWLHPGDQYAADEFWA
jgi:ketosteroid isomerase-like protein